MKELRVLIADREAGTLIADRLGKLRFVYSAVWQADKTAVPLSLSMPLGLSEHLPKVVEPFLWGLLPDNPETLSQWGRHYDVNPRNAFALLGAVGEDLPGAVQIVKPERVGELEGRASVTWLSKEKLADGFAELMRDPGSTQFTKSGGRFSLAGAQRKKALYLVNGRWGEPRGRTPSTHILKPPISGLAGQIENEMFCLRLAHALGIPTPPCWTETFGDISVVVVQRYDRVRRDGKRILNIDQAGGRVERIHQEDCCQALKYHPDKKYQRDGGPGVREVMALLEGSGNPTADRDTFMRALAFNFVIGGTDAHAKNYSVLISIGGRFRLAPLYDIASWLPYSKTGGRDKMAMSIDGHARFDQIMPRHWEAAATRSGFEPDRSTAFIRDIIARLPDAAKALLEECRKEGSATVDLVNLVDLLRENATKHAQLYGSEPLMTG